MLDYRLASLQKRTAETPGAQRVKKTNHDGCTAKHTYAWHDTETASANAASLRWNTLFAVDSCFAPIHPDDTQDRGRRSDRFDCRNAI